MGRGRQKAKQTRMARKLKYLTTDTNYDELAKELAAHSDDPFSAIRTTPAEEEVAAEIDEQIEDEIEVVKKIEEEAQEDLDEYAKWAQEVAAKARRQK